MSSRTAAIGIKQQLRENIAKLQAIGMYFRHYKLNEHFLLFINAMKDGAELPPKLVVDKTEDNGES